MVNRDQFEVLSLVLTKRAKNDSFGFSILGGSGSSLPIVISDIDPSSPAGRCGQLEVGDILLEANGLSLEDNRLSTIEVTRYLQGQPHLTLELKIKKDPTTRRRTIELNKDPFRIEQAISPTNLQTLETVKLSDGRTHTLPRATAAAAAKSSTLRRSANTIDKVVDKPSPSPHSSGFTHPGGFEALRNAHPTPVPTVECHRHLTKSMPTDVHLIGDCNHLQMYPCDDQSSVMSDASDTTLDGFKSDHNPECIILSDYQLDKLSSQLAACGDRVMSTPVSPGKGTNSHWVDLIPNYISSQSNVITRANLDDSSLRASLETTMDRSGSTNTLTEEDRLKQSAPDDPSDAVVDNNTSQKSSQSALTNGNCTPPPATKTRNDSTTDDELSPLQTAHFNSPILGVSQRNTVSPLSKPLTATTSNDISEDDTTPVSKRLDYNSSDVTPLSNGDHNVEKLSSSPSSIGSGIKTYSVNRRNSFDSNENDEDEDDYIQYSILEKLDISPPNPRPTTEIDLAAAKRLASRLFHLNGFDKSDVPRHLGKKQEFSQAVASEYFKFFDFSEETVDVSLRRFFQCIFLCGDTQERERILSHFARRYHDCNPSSFPSFESVDYLVTAIVLLNQDLNLRVGGGGSMKPMTMQQFVANVITKPPLSQDAPPEEYSEYSRDMLEQLYTSIREDPLICGTGPAAQQSLPTPGGHLNGPLPPPGIGDIPLFADEYMLDSNGSDQEDGQGGSGSRGQPTIAGVLSRKWLAEPDLKKTGKLKRSWKDWYVTLNGLNLYHHKSVSDAAKGDHKHVISLHHCLATIPARPGSGNDVSSSSSTLSSTRSREDSTTGCLLFVIRTADWGEYMYRVRTTQEELQNWVNTINLVSAFSAPPMMPPLSNKKTFTRHFRPPELSTLKLPDQIALWGSWVNQCQLLLSEVNRRMQNHPSATISKAAQAEYDTEINYYTFEMQRYQTYQDLLIEYTNRCVQACQAQAAAEQHQQSGGGGGGFSYTPTPLIPINTKHRAAPGGAFGGVNSKAVDYGVL